MSGKLGVGMKDGLAIAANSIVVLTALFGIVSYIIYYFRNNFVSLRERKVLDMAQQKNGHVRIVLASNIKVIKVGGTNSEMLDFNSKQNKSKNVGIIASLEKKGFISRYQPDILKGESLAIEPYHWVVADKTISLVANLTKRICNKLRTK